MLIEGAIHLRSHSIPLIIKLNKNKNKLCSVSPSPGSDAAHLFVELRFNRTVTSDSQTVKLRTPARADTKTKKECVGVCVHALTYILTREAVQCACMLMSMPGDGKTG